MDLNQIRSFLAVTQTLNFTNAARQNGVPQSTISRQISDLESQLGVRLFYRTRRDVQLTQEGRTFLPYALEMMEASQKGAFAVRQLRDGAAGRLSLPNGLSRNDPAQSLSIERKNGEMLTIPLPNTATETLKLFGR